MLDKTIPLTEVLRLIVECAGRAHGHCEVAGEQFGHTGCTMPEQEELVTKQKKNLL